jgi:hypothetical protein
MTPFRLYKRLGHKPKPPNQNGMPRMATFNFAETIKTVKSEEDYAKLAVQGRGLTPEALLLCGPYSTARLNWC